MLLTLEERNLSSLRMSIKQMILADIMNKQNELFYTMENIRHDG
jgi:hypothetical protein